MPDTQKVQVFRGIKLTSESISVFYQNCTSTPGTWTDPRALEERSVNFSKLLLDSPRWKQEEPSAAMGPRFLAGHFSCQWPISPEKPARRSILCHQMLGSSLGSGSTKPPLGLSPNSLWSQFWFTFSLDGNPEDAFFGSVADVRGGLVFNFFMERIAHLLPHTLPWSQIWRWWHYFWWSPSPQSGSCQRPENGLGLLPSTRIYPLNPWLVEKHRCSQCSPIAWKRLKRRTASW